MCCPDAPDPPDLQAQADASVEVARMSLDFAQEQLGWSKEVYEEQKAIALDNLEWFREQGTIASDIALENLQLTRSRDEVLQGLAQDQLQLAKDQQVFNNDLARENFEFMKQTYIDNKENIDRVLDIQVPIMEFQFQKAQEDRIRYEDVFQPIEDNLIAEFQSYDTEQRRELEAGRYAAQAQKAIDAQRNNAEQRLSELGIDPSQLRAQSLDTQMGVLGAAQIAAASNAGRQKIEDQGRILRAGAIDIGKGLPAGAAAQAAQAVGTGTNVAGIGQNAANAGTAGYNAATNTALAAGNSGFANLSNSFNNFNAGIPSILAAGQGNISAFNAGTNAYNAGLAGLNSAAGIGMSGYAGANNFLGTGLSGYGQSANILSQDYNNQLNAFNSGTDPFGLIGGLGAAWLTGGGGNPFTGKDGGYVRTGADGGIPFKTGGEIQGPGGPRGDVIEAQLSDGEYIVPEHVVKWKGQEFFQKLLDKSEQDISQARELQALPAPRPQAALPRR